jgi:hypothetical protein
VERERERERETWKLVGSTGAPFLWKESRCIEENMVGFVDLILNSLMNNTQH